MGSELHCQCEFLHNYYTFESVNNGDHDGVVRIFVALSCELWDFFTPLRTWRHNCYQRAMAINGKTKGLRTPPPRWVSAQLLYIWVSAWQRSHWCSQNLCRPFLRAARFIYSVSRGAIFLLPGV